MTLRTQPRLVVQPPYAPSWSNDGVFLPIRSIRKLLDGEPIAWLETGDARLPAVCRVGDRFDFGFDPYAVAEDILLERWRRVSDRPVTSLLPFHYHTVPGRLRTLLARLIGKTKARGPTHPWSPDPHALEFLRALLSTIDGGGANRWPEGKTWAFCTTHDVDTIHGFRLIPRFRRIEEDAGIVAQWNIVAAHYPIDWGVLRSLEESGHEIASHGLFHDNRLAFLPPGRIEERLKRIRETFEGRVTLRGFRSPSLFTSNALFNILPRYFEYDSSLCDVDEEGRGGCRSLFPFRRGAIDELPITLPMDSSLIFQGCAPHVVLRRWLDKLEWIKAVGGVAVLVTHSEPHFSGNDPMLGVYRQILDHVRRDPAVWISTPAAIQTALRAV
ncbi:MAG: hypothetical protein A2Z34_00075 [Planctomycetes bacterium RBG_16_59_8]|nr:MAG: hypothetical protein A2Z34_00075 [Planctomycetes bacterium RBG_16_59_8]